MVQSLNVNGSDTQLQAGQPLPFDPADGNTPASNTAAVVTIGADAAHPIILSQIWCSYTATPTGGYVQVEDGSGNIIWKQYLAGAGPHQFFFDPPRSGTAGAAMIITLSAGGSGISGSLDVNSRKHV